MASVLFFLFFIILWIEVGVILGYIRAERCLRKGKEFPSPKETQGILSILAGPFCFMVSWDK